MDLHVPIGRGVEAVLALSNLGHLEALLMVNGQVAMDPALAHTAPVIQMHILHEPLNLDRVMGLAMDPVMALAVDRAMALAINQAMALAVDRAMVLALNQATALVLDRAMALAMDQVMALVINRAMALAIDLAMDLAMVPAVVATVDLLHTMIFFRLITPFFSESFEMAR